MRYFPSPAHLLLRPACLLLLGLTGCVAGGSDSNSTIQFHGEQPLLPDWSKDTGLVPAASPVQLELMFSAGGGLTADAKATAGGQGDSLAVAATPGSGVFALDGHVKLAGKLHVDVSGLKYDGSIPGLDDIDVAFGNTTKFDPFLIGTMAHLSVAVPEITLPPIPLPGGLPGSLHVTVSGSSKIETDLRGDCASIDATALTVHYQASTITSGTLVVMSTVVLSIPLVGDKSFDIPTFTIPIPAVTAPFDLGTASITAGGTAPTGDSLATRGSCSDPNDPNGPGTCDADPGTHFVPVWHPPTGPHQDACTTTALDAFNAACISGSRTASACQAFKAANAACFACVVTPSTSLNYGPIVAFPSGDWYLNPDGCVAIVAPANLSCGKRYQAVYECEEAACRGCSVAERQACQDQALQGGCATYEHDFEACYDVLATAAPSCFDWRHVPQLLCGA